MPESQFTTLPLPHCDHAGCPGHLGKFSSCLDEWLWECSLDGDADESFGDTDWRGHYTMLIVSDDPSWTGRPGGGDSTMEPVTPKPGTYMVETATSGAVSVAYFETVEECMSAYAELCDEYYRWSDEETGEVGDDD